MTKSILGKLGLVVAANLHELLDAAVDMNSVPVIKQQIRNLEKSEETISVQAAVAKGQVTVLTREIDQIVESTVNLRKRIDKILTDDDESNDTNAVPLQLQVQVLEKRLDAKEEERATAEKTAASLKDIQKKVKSKLGELTGRISELENIDRTTKAKEKAADVLQQAHSLSGVDASVSVDNYERDIRARAATAEARLDDILANTTDADESLEIDARAALEKRKKELKDAAERKASAA